MMEAERSPSVESKESEVDIDLPPEADHQPEEPSEEDEACALTELESFMSLTEEEEQAWETMIKNLEDKMKEHGDNFSNWSDKITRRRMYAYSRIKKLEKISSTRKDFYCDIDKFIHAFHGDVLKGCDEKVNVLTTESEIQTVKDHNQTHTESLPEAEGLQKLHNTPQITEVPQQGTKT